MKTNTAVLTMIVAMVAMIGMTGSAMAASTMDYTVEFDAVGTGSMQIDTLSPDGIDQQLAQWGNCVVTGIQQGMSPYNSNGWTEITRSTSMNSLAASTVSGLIQTQTTVDSAPGYNGMTVTAVAKLEDGYVGNAPEDFITLDQTTYLRDGDDEKIQATTDIAGRVFNYSNSDSPFVLGQVGGVSDGTNTASSLIQARLTMGEFDLHAYTVVTDDPANVEASGTEFGVYVPDMSFDPQGYTEKADGMIYGYAAIDGVIVDSMIATFENVDTANAFGYLYAVTL